MRKIFKTVTTLVTVAALAFLGVRVFPSVYSLLFGNSTLVWESTRLSEELQKVNEMVVLRWEVTGEETVTKDVNFLLFTASTQKLKIPYEFSMEFKVNFAKAKIEVTENTILVRVPSPYGANPKLTVDEEAVTKSDFFDPVSIEQYSAYKQQLEDRLFEEGCAQEENVLEAWEQTVQNVTALYQSIVGANGEAVEVRVIRDDTLAEEGS